MMVKCLKCGALFDEDSARVEKEDYGFYWGEPCYRSTRGCPICGGQYEETKQCAICGEDFLPDDLTSGVCSECIDNYRHDFKTCYKVSQNEPPMKMEINALLYYLFDSTEIEQILKDYINARWLDVDCSEYIDMDKMWFAENLVKELKHGKQ